jgi:hypothetical protein
MIESLSNITSYNQERILDPTQVRPTSDLRVSESLKGDFALKLSKYDIKNNSIQRESEASLDKLNRNQELLDNSVALVNETIKVLLGSIGESDNENETYASRLFHDRWFKAVIEDADLGRSWTKLVYSQLEEL